MKTTKNLINTANVIELTPVFVLRLDATDGFIIINIEILISNLNSFFILVYCPSWMKSTARRYSLS